MSTLKTTLLATVLSIALAPAAFAQAGGGSQEDPANQIAFTKSAAGKVTRANLGNAYAQAYRGRGRIYLSAGRLPRSGRAVHPTDWDRLGAF